MDEASKKQTQQSTISATLVGEQYNTLDLQSIESYRNKRGKSADRQHQEKLAHGSRHLLNQIPNNDVVTDERPMPFEDCEPTPFVNMKLVSKFDYQCSPMSSISSFNSSSEESHITNSTNLSFPHQNKNIDVSKSSGNNSLMGEKKVKCAPSKPKRVSKSGTSKNAK